jgi:AraC-like DNA-binding protein
MHILPLPRGSRLEIGTDDSGMRSVTLLARRSDVSRVFGRASAAMDDLLQGHSREVVSATLPLAVHRVAEEVMSGPPDSGLAPLFFRAKAAELLWQIAYRLRSGNDQICARKLSERTRRSLEIVRLRIEQQPENVPTIEVLGRMAGMNRTKLRALFKKVYGTTICDYRAAIIMDRADELLTNSALSVAEIGYKLGYTEPSSFNMAFKRRFGCPPGQVRRQQRSGLH